MARQVLAVLSVAVLVVLATGVVATVLLALGTVLALIFAVAVWQATMVATAVAGGVLWLLTKLLWVGELVPESWEEQPLADFSGDDAGRPARAGRRRRR